MTTNNNQNTEKKNGLMDFLRSLRLAIYLFIILALASIVGTVIQQEGGMEDQKKIVINIGFNTAKILTALRIIDEPKSMDEIYSIGEKTYNILNKFQLFDMYHSWWFLAVMVLFSVNLFLCTIQRLPNALKFYTEPVVKPQGSAGTKFKTIKTGSAKGDKPLAAVKDILSNRIGEPLEVKDEDGTYLLFQKGKIGRLGVYITHLSIFFIFLGSIIGNLLGFKGYVSLVEGQQTSTYWDLGKDKEIPLGFDLKCENAYVEYYKNYTGGMPKDWYSTLSVIVDGKIVASKKIEVNDPLTYKGLTFYQSSFGKGGVKKVVVNATPRDGGQGKAVPIPLGATAKVDDVTTLKLLRFVPDFVIAGDEVGSKSDEMNNPAIQLEIMEGEDKYAVWLFKNYPDFHPFDKGKYDYKLAGIEASNRTGLQVAKDPGVNWVWVGCVLLMVGLYISFFVPHKRVWVKASGNEIEISGTTTKNKPSFENEMLALTNEIERSLKC